FEVARAYRFARGSGMPVRIPVIDMVEIGAGGGSIGRVDSLHRIAVGPDSAGSAPGPACYGLGGSQPTRLSRELALPWACRPRKRHGVSPKSWMRPWRVLRVCMRWRMARTLPTA